MSNVIGSLRINLGMESTAFNRGASAAEKRMAEMQKNFEAMGARLRGIGLGLSVGLTAPLVALGKRSADAAKVQEQAIAAVEAALVSMGDGAGRTSQQLQEMASQLQANSLFGDEDILRDVTANLLTFGNIAEEQFDRAQQAAVDLSARLGRDLQSSALTVGKALNDPIRGLEALRDASVVFTDEQKNQIRAMTEAGDLMGAQSIMLEELERQYGGQARALAETDSGQLTKAALAISDAFEDIGAVILPVLADVAQVLSRWAERFQELSPRVQKLVVVGGALAAALGPVAIVMGSIVTVGSALLPVFAGIGAVVGAISAPVIAAVAALVGLGAAAVYIWRNWDDVKTRIAELPETFRTMASAAVTRFKEGLAALVDRAREQIAAVKTAITERFTGLYDDMFAAGQRVLIEVVAGIKAKIEDVRTAIAEVATVISEGVTGALDAVRDFFADVDRGIEEGGRTTGSRARKAGRGIAQNVEDGFRDEAGIRSPSTVFKGLGGDLMDGLAEGIRDGIAAAEEAAREAARSVESVMRDTFGNFAEDLARGGFGNAFANLGRNIMSGAARAFGDLFSDAFSPGGGGFGGLMSSLGTSFGGLFGGGISGFLTNALPIVGAINAGVSLLKGLFGSSTVIGQGIDLGFSGGEVAGGTFTRKRWSALFGLISGTSTSLSPFDADTQAALQARFEAIQGGLVETFAELGLAVNAGAVAGVEVARRQFDTRGKSEEEIERFVADTFLGFADTVSRTFTGLSASLATNLVDVSAILRPAGQAFFGEIEAMGEAAADLAGRFGGASGLSGAVGAFAEAFFTEGEKLAAISDEVARVFDRLNLAMPATDEAFKRLVLSQNLMTESGRAAYAALLDIAPAFDALTDGLAPERFDLSTKDYTTGFEARLAQIAAATGREDIALLQQMNDKLDDIFEVGIPARP